MPGVYQPQEFDLVGTIVGWVERENIITGSAISEGDILIGLPSSGLHTNGFSLARHVFRDVPLDAEFPELYGNLADTLLAPHRSYLQAITRLIDEGIDIRGMAHITGGGFYENIPRVLPDGLGVRIVLDTWPVLPIFRLIQDIGQIKSEEMYHVFNMGIGLIVVVPPAQAQLAIDILEHGRPSSRGGRCPAI